LFEVDNKNDFVRAWDNNLVLKDIWFESLKA